MITYQTEGVEMPSIRKRETTEWVKAVAQTYGKKVGEIAYIFCSDEKILEVNRQHHHLRLYRRKPHCGRPVYQPRHGAHQCRTIQCPV